MLSSWRVSSLSLPPKESTLREIALGSVIAGRYEVLSCLGAGGMGTVFKAHDRLLGETVALKVAREGRLEERLLDRMRAEVKLARTVRHPNVCAVHDYGEDGGTVFLSMQYVPGRDLRALLDDRGSLPWEEAYAVVMQVADGLVAIHDAGIIHRDLKPANVMVDERGVARVVDFGVALWRAGGAVVGTGAPGYMSPEQIRGQPIDFRSDLYCFGCLIYEAFTSCPPFWADTPMGVMLKHLEEPPPLDGAPAVQLPRSLLPVLSRALAKEPAGRHAHSREMREALGRARSSLEFDTTDGLGKPFTDRAMPPPAAREKHTSNPVARPERVRTSSPRAISWPSWLLSLMVAGLIGGIGWMSSWNAPRPAGASRTAATLVTSHLPAPATVAVLPPVVATSSPAARLPRRSPTPAPVPISAPTATPSPPAAISEPIDPSPNVAPSSAASTTVTTTSTTATTLRPATSPTPEAVVTTGALVDINDPDVRPPVCQSCPAPGTPLIAEHPDVVYRLRGKNYIVMQILVDEGGRVAEVKPLRDVEILTQAAVKAARKWRYRPAQKNGVAVKVWLGVAIRFRLPGDPPSDEPSSLPRPRPE